MRDSELYCSGKLIFKVLPTPPTLNYNSSTRFPEFLLVDDLLCCLCDLSMEYFDTQFLHVYNWSDGVFGNDSFLKISLCVESNI